MLNNQVVVITGASSGIGLETAKLVAKFHGIPVLTARSEERLRMAAALIRTETGVEAGVFPLDVTSEQQVNQTVAEIVEHYGRINVWINNAGFGYFSSIDHLPLESYMEMMDVNFFGVVRCTKAVIPFMRRQNGGHIINVASVAGKMGTAKATAYSPTKFAVVGFGESLRQELAGTGIHISTFCPGPVETPFFDKADPDGRYKERVRFFMLPPRKVARELIHMINKKPAERIMPSLARAGVLLAAMFPSTFHKLLGKQINRK